MRKVGAAVLVGVPLGGFCEEVTLKLWRESYVIIAEKAIWEEKISGGLE